MLLSRLYKPTDEAILYHYYDATAFHAICSTRHMRFSDLFSLNDALEIHWGYSIWEAAATQLLDKIGRPFLDELDKIIHTSGICGLPVVSCYSPDGDVLSQWRAYADDGRGYAIGFKAKELLKLPVRPLRVLYDREEQIKELKNTILAVHEVEQSEKEKFGGDFRTVCFTMAFDLAAFKNPAFEEEKEVRLIHILDFEESNGFLRLRDAGGRAFGKDVDGVPVSFRMREHIPVAFIDQDFTNQRTVNPISVVIVGPKNDVQLTAISIFLETMGIGGVTVRKSKASYR